MGASSIAAFGENQYGELFCTGSGGRIYRIVSADCTPVSTINLGTDSVGDCGSGSVGLTVPVNPSYQYAWTHNGNPVVGTGGVVANQSGVYAVTVTNQGCTGTDSIYVNIGAPTPVTFTGLDSLMCIYHSAVILTPSEPGGEFSGTGVNSNGFSPNIAGLGTHQVVYAFTDAFGCFVTDTQTVIVDACLSVPENQWVNTISVMPNPSRGDFYINAYSPVEKKIFVEVTDVTGKRILSETIVVNNGDNAIPVRLSAAEGVYLVKITDEKSSTAVRLVIEN